MAIRIEAVGQLIPSWFSFQQPAQQKTPHEGALWCVRPEGPRRDAVRRLKRGPSEPRFECTQHATNKKDPSRGSVLLVRPEGFEPPTF